MEIKIGITNIAREVTFESDATPDEVAEKVRAAVAESSLLDLTDDKGRRILVPGERLGYVDLGSPTARAVGFGAV
ncbi:MAG: DUF3107 domain-containing protein [Tessaracoccus sp.]|uniref:DUF3107 domain-containing protein n=1 Tax=Tessaracoccus sp. TaxID=1971211 RepID=UPI001EBFE764|nr:DUF3107 domain-containing protein [Tessaracoccus sp.]MBK7820350.1 DUF3107 domain-containing protein [Tessaracoccus sp.]